MMYTNIIIPMFNKMNGKMHAVSWLVVIQNHRALTLCIRMELSIHIDTPSMGLSIVNFKGSELEISE